MPLVAIQRPAAVAVSLPVLSPRKGKGRGKGAEDFAARGGASPTSSSSDQLQHPDEVAEQNAFIASRSASPPCPRSPSTAATHPRSTP
jgi:hypothetical protein